MNSDMLCKVLSKFSCPSYSIDGPYQQIRIIMQSDETVDYLSIDDYHKGIKDKAYTIACQCHQEFWYVAKDVMRTKKRNKRFQSVYAEDLYDEDVDGEPAMKKLLQAYEPIEQNSAIYIFTSSDIENLPFADGDWANTFIEHLHSTYIVDICWKHDDLEVFTTHGENLKAHLHNTLSR